MKKLTQKSNLKLGIKKLHEFYSNNNEKKVASYKIR